MTIHKSAFFLTRERVSWKRRDTCRVPKDPLYFYFLHVHVHLPEQISSHNQRGHKQKDALLKQQNMEVLGFIYTAQLLSINTWMNPFVQNKTWSLFKNLKKNDKKRCHFHIHFQTLYLFFLGTFEQSSHTNDCILFFI